LWKQEESNRGGSSEAGNAFASHFID